METPRRDFLFTAGRFLLLTGVAAGALDAIARRPAIGGPS